MVRAATGIKRLLAPITLVGCSGPKVNTQAAVLHKGLIPYIHKTPFIQWHFKALVHPAYTEQRAKLSSVTFAPCHGGKNNQGLMRCLSPGCTRYALGLRRSRGPQPSGMQVIHDPRSKVDTHTTWPIVPLVAFVREHKGAGCLGFTGRNTPKYQNNWMLWHLLKGHPETQSQKKTNYWMWSAKLFVLFHWTAHEGRNPTTQSTQLSVSLRISIASGAIVIPALNWCQH